MRSQRGQSAGGPSRGLAFAPCVSPAARSRSTNFSTLQSWPYKPAFTLVHHLDRFYVCPSIAGSMTPYPYGLNAVGTGSFTVLGAGEIWRLNRWVSLPSGGFQYAGIREAEVVSPAEMFAYGDVWLAHSQYGFLMRGAGRRRSFLASGPKCAGNALPHLLVSALRLCAAAGTRPGRRPGSDAGVLRPAFGRGLPGPRRSAQGQVPLVSAGRAQVHAGRRARQGESAQAGRRRSSMTTWRCGNTNRRN
jgi:hypothetical protein